MHIVHLQQGLGPYRRQLLLRLIQVVVLSFMLAGSLWAQSAERWLVLGDSLSAAYGIPKEAGWVSLLDQRLSERAETIEVMNASLSGETTSGGLQRLPKLLEQYRPGVVIIALGANDALRGQDLRASERHLRKMIDLCKKQKARVVLLGIRLPSNYGPAYNKVLSGLYASLGQEFDLLFDPFFLEDVALDTKLMQDDGLHPNLKAQPIIFERIWRLLQPLLGADQD